MMKALIVDGYVDEPALLGVPPYVSTYPRYIAGAFLHAGIEVEYLTIDQIREESRWLEPSEYDYMVIIAGLSVSGHYLGGTPLTLTELKKLVQTNPYPRKFLIGPIVLGYSLKGGTTALSTQLEEIEFLPSNNLRLLWERINGRTFEGGEYEFIDLVAPAGAEILKKHPRFPNVICELELSRGCERRDGFCSFCTEPLIWGRFTSRPLEGLIREVKALSNVGVKAFRFGRSANIFAYGEKNGKPDPVIFEELFSEVSRFQPEVLHCDNANPAYMYKHRKAVEKMLETIVRYNTPGDVLSFGVESFDPEVRRLNNIQGDPEEILEAVRMVNAAGASRVYGIPRLLPGINILGGLYGESEKTYDINYRWLKRISDEGLLLRRINIRQVMIFSSTTLYRLNAGKYRSRKYLSAFKRFKERVRSEIDLPMMKKVFPTGAVLRSVHREKKQGDITYGRQLGSYPVLVGVPEWKEEDGNIVDVIIANHGPRSVTGIVKGRSLNRAGYKEIIAVEGIGKKRAEKLIISRPFRNWEEVERIVEDTETLENLRKIFSLEG